MSVGAARSQAVSPIADKQNGLLGKLACQLDGSANTIFLVVPKVAGSIISHKTRVLRREEINSQTFLETALLSVCTLLMPYNTFSWISQVKTQLMVLLCLCSKSQMHCIYHLYYALWQYKNVSGSVSLNLPFSFKIAGNNQSIMQDDPAAVVWHYMVKSPWTAAWQW